MCDAGSRAARWAGGLKRVSKVVAIAPRVLRGRKTGQRGSFGRKLARIGTVICIAALSCGWFPSRMEDTMCWEIDYKLFAEQKKAQEIRIEQERRAGVIDQLLNEANKQGERSNVEGTPVKETAPAK
jgi:hypothetical protein